VDINGERESLVLPAGERRTLVKTYAIFTDTTYVVAVTGDITRTLAHAVTFGEAAAATFSPQPVYTEGIVSIPYTLTNTGQLPTTVDLEIGGFEIWRFSDYLPVGATASGNLLSGLSPGNYVFTYTTPFETGVVPFRVAPSEAAELAVSAGPTVGNLITVTAVVTNTGALPFSGTLHLETPFLQTDHPISLSPCLLVSCPNASYAIPVNTAAAAPGTYHLTLTLLSGSGLPLASSALSVTVRHRRLSGDPHRHRHHRPQRLRQPERHREKRCAGPNLRQPGPTGQLRGHRVRPALFRDQPCVQHPQGR